ncbi:MAG: hypothetical protein LBT56_06860 [Prevotellaceae bacterium]|jgi:hypothetical protein|nr:hypothetical protein [Prevotellaceae bacterium]
MNKKLIIVLLACVALFVSCNEEDNYESDLSVQILAGEWQVFGDPYMGDDGWILRTANTVENSKNAIILTDAQSFWYFTVKVPAEPWSPSFGQETPVTNLYYDVDVQDPIIVPYDIGVIVKNGKVTPKAITLPSGWKADKISFTLAFEDDYPEYAEYRIVGYRISGFLEDVGYVYHEQ